MKRFCCFPVHTLGGGVYTQEVLLLPFTCSHSFYVLLNVPNAPLNHIPKAENWDYPYRSWSYNAAISYCTFWHNFAKLSLSLDYHSIALNLRFSSSALLLWQWRISLIQSSTYACFVHSIRLFALWQQTYCFLPSTSTHLPKAVAPAFHKGRLSVIDLRIGMVALREHTVPEAIALRMAFSLWV